MGLLLEEIAISQYHSRDPIHQEVAKIPMWAQPMLYNGARFRTRGSPTELVFENPHPDYE